MATRGVYQLTKIQLNYCEYGGSSRMVRDYLAAGMTPAALLESSSTPWPPPSTSKNNNNDGNNNKKKKKTQYSLLRFAQENPHIDIDVKVRNGHHPYVRGFYKNVSPNTTPHQICIKNMDSLRDINDVLEKLRNRSGKKVKKVTNPIKTDTPSIQGAWTPMLDLYVSNNDHDDESSLFPIEFVSNKTDN